MHKLAVLLKSYAGDLNLATRLVKTFVEHNPDGLPMFCIVPEADLPAFSSLASEHVTVMSEEVLAAHLVSTPVADLRAGYINQEIIKLAFHELGLAENYFCVDSDAEFIRDIHLDDFVAPDGYPYSVLVEDNDLKSDPTYFRQYWQSREQALRHIYALVDLEDDVIRTCHGHQIFSAAVLASFVTEFLSPRGWDYRDALAEAPYEFTWYNAWLQKSGVIPIHAREPLVKVYHHERQHQEALLLNVTREDLARAYVAVVVNGNFTRELVEQPDSPSKSDALAPYLSYGEVAGVLAAKIRSTARRRFGHRP